MITAGFMKTDSLVYTPLMKTIYLSQRILVQCVPRKGFGNFETAVCVQSDRYIVYIVSLSADLADPNPFRGTHCI